MKRNKKIKDRRKALINKLENCIKNGGTPDYHQSPHIMENIINGGIFYEI